MHVIDHVALVVSDLEAALQSAHLQGVPAGPIEAFPSEGTREVYLGGDRQAGALLLMQPLGEDGPYARALATRGPGLHHVALHVPSLEEEIARLSGSGWYLHLKSLASAARSRTVWLARPGVGALIELHESTRVRSAPALITDVAIPTTCPDKPLFEALGVASLQRSQDGFAWLTVAGGRWRADQLGG